MTDLVSTFGAILFLLAICGFAAASWGLPLVLARRAKARNRPIRFFIWHVLLSCFAYFAILGASVGAAALPLIALPALGVFSTGQILSLVQQAGFMPAVLLSFSVAAIVFVLAAWALPLLRPIALLLTLLSGTFGAMALADHAGQKRIEAAAENLAADCLHAMSLWNSARQRLGTFTVMGEPSYKNRHATAWVGQTYYGWSYTENRFVPINTVARHFKRDSACPAD